MGRKAKNKSKARKLAKQKSRRAKRQARKTSPPSRQTTQALVDTAAVDTAPSIEPPPRGTHRATDEPRPTDHKGEREDTTAPVGANPLDLLTIALQDPKLVACHPEELDALAETIERLRSGKLGDDQNPVDEAQAMGREPVLNEVTPDVVSQIVRLLVLGERVLSPGATKPTVRYPTYRELAERFGVHHSTIGRYSKAHQCLERRRRIQARAHARAAQLHVQRVVNNIEDVYTQNADVLERIFERLESWLETNQKELPPMKEVKILLDMRATHYDRALRHSSAVHEDPVDAIMRLLKEEHLLGLGIEQDDARESDDVRDHGLDATPGAHGDADPSGSNLN